MSILIWFFTFGLFGTGNPVVIVGIILRIHNILIGFAWQKRNWEIVRLYESRMGMLRFGSRLGIELESSDCQAIALISGLPLPKTLFTSFVKYSNSHRNHKASTLFRRAAIRCYPRHSLVICSYQLRSRRSVAALSHGIIGFKLRQIPASTFSTKIDARVSPWPRSLPLPSSTSAANQVLSREDSFLTSERRSRERKRPLAN